MSKLKSRTERQMLISETLQAVREDFMLQTELTAAIATATKVKFDAFVTAGFTEQQAMDLLCAAERRS